MTHAWLVAVLTLGYMLSAGRVIEQLVQARGDQTALRVELALEGLGAPDRALLELHPQFGLRVSDDRGGRWILQRGRLVEGAPSPLPSWLPPLDVVVLRSEASIREWLATAGIDAERNGLGLCGENDCYVIGGREARGQLWLERERLEVARLELIDGRSVRLEAWQDWGSARFPSQIDVLDARAALTTLRVESVSSAGDLRAQDYAPTWMK